MLCVVSAAGSFSLVAARQDKAAFQARHACGARSLRDVALPIALLRSAAGGAGQHCVIAGERYEEGARDLAQVCSGHGYPSDGKSQVQTLSGYGFSWTGHSPVTRLQSSSMSTTLADERSKIDIATAIKKL